MRIGLQIIRFDWQDPPQTLAERLRVIGQTADEVGFYSLWVMDHLFQMGGEFGPPEAPMLEGYATSAFLAGITRRIKLGVLVTAATYRAPGLLIKTVNTLDVLSNGRAYLGIGAAWYEQEAKGLGLNFPPLKDRYECLEETLLIAKQMWSDQPAPFIGKHYQLDYPVGHPLPISQPHPPILIGGEGEKKTLRLVAQYADACNFYLGATTAQSGKGHHQRYVSRRATLMQSLEILRGHCESVGRDYNTIEKTVLGTIQLDHDGMSAQAIIDLCGELNEMGFSHLILNMPDTETLRPLEAFGKDIIPQVS
ncbi:MAG: LLM class F420-dependent oxidoreductase [Anaerolineae bacterium]|jgi:F420-dependent oxidoreductase-like protein|nr:LLM class F420-dependent oxidoreductase [Anaerolineae bacterium]